jgi:anti-sigma B factor antagonist
MTEDASLAAGPQAVFAVQPGTGEEPPVVRAAGDIDLTNVGQFAAALAAATAAAGAAGAVTVDLTGITYGDSATIRALFAAARQARLTIQLSAGGPVSATLLKVAGLDQVTTVVTLE